MRNILVIVTHKEKARFAERIKQIWTLPDVCSAKRTASLLADNYTKRFPEAVRYLPLFDVSEIRTGIDFS